MNACAFPLAEPASKTRVGQVLVGRFYVVGHDLEIDAGLAIAGIDGQGKTWWGIRDALCAAGDIAAASRAESLAIPF